MCQQHVLQIDCVSLLVLADDVVGQLFICLFFAHVFPVMYPALMFDPVAFADTITSMTWKCWLPIKYTLPSILDWIYISRYWYLTNNMNIKQQILYNLNTDKWKTWKICGSLNMFACKQPQSVLFHKLLGTGCGHNLRVWSLWNISVFLAFR